MQGFPEHIFGSIVIRESGSSRVMTDTFTPSLCRPDVGLAVALESGRSKGVRSVKATIEAFFEDGVFKPVGRPDIPEGEHVQLTVETTAGIQEDPLELAARVYRGLQPEEIDEIERMALDRSHFFTSARP
jgi:predicted DNA-binding antitoxin AbrB/MazE fold protein